MMMVDLWDDAAVWPGADDGELKLSASEDHGIDWANDWFNFVFFFFFNLM